MGTTLLRQVVSPGNLRRAWDEVAENKGIAGVDHVSIRKWRRSWEARLARISKEVLSNTYKPQRLRVRKIPKRDRRDWRKLRIPTVTDRVLQRAVLQVLYPIFEPRFLDCSFGYRPGRGLRDAVERILVIRVNDYPHVLDADIDDFFNQVDHPLLREMLVEDLPDRSLLQLIQSWLDIGKPDPDQSRGIPMGSPLSPLLANIYLHRLDQAVLKAGYELVRYADDFLVFTANESRIAQAYEDIRGTLASLRLGYEPQKTRLTTFEQGFSFIGVWFEGDSYEYEWENKRIEVHGDEVDPLFSRFGPNY